MKVGLPDFFARSYKDILKVLLICSHDDIRVDRVTNRDNVSVEEAKHWIKQRENEKYREMEAVVWGNIIFGTQNILI